MPLEHAIHQMTEVPALRVQIPDRGRLADGYAADLVIFDPATIANRATENDPSARPAGIDRVMVNGQWVVRDGASTGARPVAPRAQWSTQRERDPPFDNGPSTS